jgi:hypothetical protein
VKRYEIALLALAILVGLVVRLYFFTGLIASDDLTYALSAHYMFSSPLERPFDDSVAGGVAVRRIGLNFPLFLATRVFGVHEWSLALGPMVFSLAGIPVIYGVLRIIAGSPAGLLAAWVWACLPVDVYNASLWLPDNIFATVFAGFLLFLVASEHCERARTLLAFAAGLALGYLEYVKEIAYLFMLPLVFWWAYTWWRTRRIDWRPAFVGLGFLAVQVLASAYFWSQGGHPLVFWRLSFLRYADVMMNFEQRNPFPANLTRAYEYLCQQWILGYSVLVLPVLLILGLVSRASRMRGRLAMLLLLQAYMVFEGIKLGSWTQRYFLQATPTLILLAILGLRALLARLPPHWDRRVMLLGSLAMVLATAGALRPERQQHGRFRADGLRDAFAYLDATAQPDDPIYLVASNVYWDGRAAPFYTLRSLSLLAGFKPFKGGFRDLAEAYDAKSGWVVLTHLEGQYLNRPGDVKVWGLAPNWLEVLHAGSERSRRYYARVFKILPEPPPPFVKVVDKTTYPVYPPDVSRLEFQPICVLGSPERFVSRRWNQNLAELKLQAAKPGLRCEMTAQPLTGPRPVKGQPGQADGAYGGVQFIVPSLAALRLGMELINPENVQSIHVYAYGESSGQLIQWRWRLSAAQRKQAAPGLIVLVPSKPSGHFRVSGDVPPQAIREVHVFLRIAAGSRAGFLIRQAEIATTESVDRELEPASLRPVSFDGPASGFLSPRTGASRQVEATAFEGGLRCNITGNPESTDHQYGGLQFRVPPLGALRLRISLIDPGNIVGLWADGYDADRQRVARWEWRPGSGRAVPDVPITDLLIPGQSGQCFEFVDGGEGGPIRKVHVFTRVRPGTDAGFVLHSAEASKAAASDSQPTSDPAADP